MIAKIAAISQSSNGLTKMAAICPNFEWLGIWMSDSFQNPDQLQPFFNHSKSRPLRYSVCHFTWKSGLYGQQIECHLNTEQVKFQFSDVSKSKAFRRLQKLFKSENSNSRNLPLGIIAATNSVSPGESKLTSSMHWVLHCFSASLHDFWALAGSDQENQ